ncbi:hypothetical protein [Mucilaginibacter sp.]|uniref:hypothetical protein n=1 Tax=Mucilaginibacter sp. TaxID=1882438 RepID=UPI00283E4D09|nr:hypothetical protein [Mucilaginibacter sp.]MDR3696213.1 hypothetical protein [Mucilaginibacter sp.]
MKKMILAVAALGIAGFTMVKAGPSTQNTRSITTIAVTDTAQKTPIKLDELPPAVKTTLTTDPVKQWTPTTAFVVKSGSTVYFEITVKKDTQTQVIKLDKDGKMVQ